MTIDSHLDWNNLLNELSSISKQPSQTTKYIPNEGNAGDALIASGMWQLFDHIGLSPAICTSEDIVEGDTVLYSGGGNFVPGYLDCRHFVEECLAKNVKKAVILPHTIRGNEDILRLLDHRFTLFCREHVSYNHARQNAPDARVLFCPDMAFYIDYKSLKMKATRPRVALRLTKHFTSNIKQGIKFGIWCVYCLLFRPNKAQIFDIYRVDIEATLEMKGSPFSDLSNHYGSKYKSREEVDIISAMFLDVLNRCKQVKTNRLHASIGAAILGKDVELYDNSYGKNKAIYDATLHTYKHVRFIANSNL